MVVAACIIGFLCGIASFAPLILGMNLARKATPTSNLGHASSLLLGVLLSSVVLALACILCLVFARDVALPFVLALACGLAVSAALFGIKKQLSK